MSPYLNTALAAARKAAPIIARAMDNIDQLEIKRKANNDLVSEIDTASEQLIIDTIRKYHPDHAILGEESGLDSSVQNQYLWVIDPLDGTRNFLHAFPHFAISIACMKNGRTEHAVILDPIRDEEFTASRGQGAYLNGRQRIRVSNCKQMTNAMMASGMPSVARQGEFHTEYSKCLEEVRDNVAAIRHAGSAALDLAYVASARLDGYWEAGLPIWDLAAGSLLIEEAGGLVCDFQGGHDYLKTGNIVCGGAKCCKQLIKMIAPYMQRMMTLRGDLNRKPFESIKTTPIQGNVG